MHICYDLLILGGLINSMPFGFGFGLVFYSLKMMTEGVTWSSSICSRLKRGASQGSI